MHSVTNDRRQTATDATLSHKRDRIKYGRLKNRGSWGVGTDESLLAPVRGVNSETAPHYVM